MEQYIKNDLFSYLILFGIIQGVILGIILLNNKGKNKIANKILGVIVIGFIISNLDFWGGYTRNTLKFPHLVDLSWPVTFAYGPLILLYFKTYLSGKLQRKDWLFLVPFFFLFLYSFTFYLQDGEYKFNVFVKTRDIALPLKQYTQSFSSNPLGIRSVGNMILIPYFITFIILSILEIIRSVKKNKIQVKYQNKPLVWLISFLTMTICVIVVFIILQIMNPSAENEYVFAIFFTFIIYFITWHFLSRSNFFDISLSDKKYAKSALTESMKDELLKRIEYAFEIEKLYRNNLFTLKFLAKSISTSPNYISQVINEKLGKNIYELLAKYRINEAKNLLRNKNRNRTIEDIALSVGYNSKAAFNKAFKKMKGQTPSEYRDVLP